MLFLRRYFYQVKNTIKYILQKLLGFRTYLYVFALFKIRTLHKDSKEKDFFRFLDLMRDGNGAILDVGANLGIMTVHLARRFPNTHIHAFEPMPDNISVLRRVLQKFGSSHAEVHEIAVGENPGNIDMILPEKSGAKMQGLTHVKHPSITEWNEGSEFSVKIDTLDNLINGEKIQGIKIDIENFEYFAFKGGKRIISTNKPVIYAELWDNENRKNCFDLLQEMNYRIHVVVEDKLVQYDPTAHHHQNFIFING